MPPASVPDIPGANTRDTRVDWLRGCAALMVLFHHAFAIPDPASPSIFAPLRAIAHWGYLGVPVFFVLSGRCVGRSWLRGAPAGVFAWRRWRRIYPPYLASLVVCGLVILFRKLTFGVNDLAPVPASLTAIIATLALATEPVTSVPAMNWVYWSLSYEVVFYALLAGLLFVHPAHLRLRTWLTLHAGLCLLDALRLGHNHGPIFFVQYWGLFAAGVGLCLHFANRPEARLSLTISAVHVFLLGTQGRLDASFLTGGLTVIALVVPSRWWRPPNRSWLVRIGLFSYSLYLIHLPVGIYFAQSQLRPVLPANLGGALILLLATLGTSVGSAWGFYRTVESRFAGPSSAAP